MVARAVRIGFMPLVDCAALVVAVELGLAEQHGVTVHLHRENSWAGLRDKLALGYLDGAHMLAGLTLALHLGLQGVGAPMMAAMSLGQGGTAITVASRVAQAMAEADPEAMVGPRPGRNRALAAVVKAARARGEPLRLASVHPFSSHYYELREWLEQGGIDTSGEVELLFIPPPRMVESLQSGSIDGFCAGEPWNQLAVQSGCGEILLTKSDLWPTAPEKVLALRSPWVAEHDGEARALIGALIEAGRWMDEPAHRGELSRLLARDAYIGVEAELILASLEQRPWLTGKVRVEVEGYHRFYADHAQFPWPAHGGWLLERMVRWGQLPAAEARQVETDRVYDAALYRAAAAALQVPLPAWEPA